MLSSTVETGFESSNASKTDGCKIPILPIDIPLYKIEAQRPSK